MNNEKVETPYTCPKGIVCPRCKQPIEFGQGVTPGATNRFRKGSIMVCAHCALITLVGDSGLVPMSKTQVMSLPPMLRDQLFATCNAIAKNITQSK